MMAGYGYGYGGYGNTDYGIAEGLITGTTDRVPRQLVTIADEIVPAFSIDTQHGLQQVKGTASIRLPMPEYSPVELRERWLNQPVEIKTGYDEDGGAQRVFAGRVNKLDRSFDRGGYRLEVRCTGWAALLDFPSESDIVFPPLTSLYEIARSLCEMRGLPMYGGELITYPLSSAPVLLGGVDYVDDGNVVIPKRSSPLMWLVNTLNLFGYYCCDRPDGMFWWGRVMGKPAASPVAVFAQGVNVFSMGREDDLDRMVTWWDVEGASYTDDDEVPVKIRSFPEEVPYNALLAPLGYNRKALSDPVLVTVPLADAARNVAEIDYAAPYEAERWQSYGGPSIQPGNVVELNASLLELDITNRWVMQVDHTASSRGLRTNWTGWQGAGHALTPGDDSETIQVFTNPQHVGDETLSHYAHPSPQGKEITFTINVPGTYTALILEGWAHGVNSYLVKGKQIDGNVSKIEVWQGDGDKPVGTATLPVMPENLKKKYPYGANNWQKYWTKFRIPVPGRLEAGSAKVKLISGEDKSIRSGKKFDDYEVRDLKLTVTGSGYPILPEGGS